MLAERAATVAQVIVADVTAPMLREEDAHHLARVLRVRDGERVCVTNGAGAWRICKWVGGVLEPITDVNIEVKPSPEITVGFALTKSDKPEWVVQKLTEIGVDVILPIVSSRSVVKWNAEKAAKNIERWQKIIEEAAMQSRRVWMPRLCDVTPYGELQLSLRVLAQPGGSAIGPENTVVLVGPEGGWSDEELATASATVELGSTILRAETAALAVAVNLCGRR